MKRAFVIAAALVATTAWIGADLAEAKRMGGGRSIGAQRQATPQAAPTTPGAPSAAPASPASPAMGAAAKAPAATAPAAGASRWLGPIAGLAAGLGLAALMSHLGLSEAFGSFLLIALLVVGGIFIVRMLMRRNAPQATRSPLQYAGNAPGRAEPVMPPGPSRFEPAMSGGASTSVTSIPANRFPAGFNPAPFIENAKQQFRALQSAYDSGDFDTLSEVMTPEMYAEVAREIGARGAQVPTEITRLDAEILEATTEGRQHWMSVRFTGLLREDGTVLPKEFEETWNLVKPTDDSSGWLLAGIQQSDAMA